MARRARIKTETAVGTAPKDRTAESQFEGAQTVTVNIDYIKGAQFRTIHPDGLIAAKKATGGIELAFYCERQAIPRRTIHNLNSDGTLGEVIDVLGRDAVVREIDISISLTTEVAEAVIRFIKKTMESSESSSSEDPSNMRGTKKTK